MRPDRRSSGRRPARRWPGTARGRSRTRAALRRAPPRRGTADTARARCRPPPPGGRSVHRRRRRSSARRRPASAASREVRRRAAPSASRPDRQPGDDRVVVHGGPAGQQPEPRAADAGHHALLLEQQPLHDPRAARARPSGRYGVPSARNQMIAFDCASASPSAVTSTGVSRSRVERAERVRQRVAGEDVDGDPLVRPPEQREQHPRFQAVRRRRIVVQRDRLIAPRPRGRAATASRRARRSTRSARPSVPITRWHGITIEIGFRPFAAPAARIAVGLSARRASSAYVIVSPNGIRRELVPDAALPGGAGRRDGDVERAAARRRSSARAGRGHPSGTGRRPSEPGSGARCSRRAGRGR